MASPELTDPRSAAVRRARRLATRAFRHEQRQFLVEGAQAVREALAAGAEGTCRVSDVFVDGEASQRHPDLLDAARRADASIHLSSDQVLAALSDTVTPQGLVAVCDFLDRPSSDLITRATRLVALLAEVRDPGNAGSVLRAADASGADSVVFSDSSVDAYNGKVVRASVGSLFHIPFAIDVRLAEAVESARKCGMQVLAADGSGEADLDSLETDGALARPTAWLFGNEAWGLPDEVKAIADRVVQIPIYGRAESLNLATAASLCLYASARSQRD